MMIGTEENTVFGTIGTGVENPGTVFDRIVGINDAIVISRAGKSQISRDSKSGRLPYTLNDKGHKQYSVKDLYTLYGFRNQSNNKSSGTEEPVKKDSGTLEPLFELAVIREQLKAKNEALRKSEEEIRDLRQTRDRLIEQNNRLTLLLPAPKNDSQESPANYQPKSFWKRLFS